MPRASESIEGAEAAVGRLMERKRWRRAIAAVESVPPRARSFDLWWNYGWALGKIREWTAAARSLSAALRLDPRSPVGHWALGIAYGNSGHPRLAERHHLCAIELKDSSLARLTLAVHYMQLGKFAAAEKVHLDGIALRPRDRVRLEQYADFLWDAGRRTESRAISRKARRLPKRQNRAGRMSKRDDR